MRVGLPAGNEQHLALRDEVAAAVADGSFRLYSVDDAVELFTGLPVGDAAAPGEDTVYARVARTLARFDEVLFDRRL